MASVTRCERLRAPSRRIALRMWVSTVAAVTESAWPTSRPVAPPATSATTSRSRWLSGCQSRPPRSGMKIARCRPGETSAIEM